VNVHSVLRECAVDLLETEPHVTVEQVVGCAYRRHGDAFADAQQQMVLAAARTIVAKLMRDLTDDEGDDQLSLPGLGLPSAIAVQDPDGTYYVRSDKATWSELLAGREVRLANVTAAQAKLDAYDESVETLRPFMEHDPLATVADAVRSMRDAA
jgi:hypothetical protein